MFQSLGWQEKARQARVPARGSREGKEIRVIAREWIYGLCRGIKRRESASVRLLPFPRSCPPASEAQPRFFSLPLASENTNAGLPSRRLLRDAAQMRPQLPLFRRSLSELAAPSKSYHALSGISINAAALIARSSPYYRRAALRHRSYAALAEFIADSRHPSLPLLSLPLSLSLSLSLSLFLSRRRKKKHALLENRNRRSR